MTSRERRLEAPHRRLEPASRGRAAGQRFVERIAVVAYRVDEWLIGHLPRRVVEAVLSVVLQASYRILPSKGRWSNANFGHVLGLKPNDPAVRKVALAAYQEVLMVHMCRSVHSRAQRGRSSRSPRARTRSCSDVL